MNKKVVSLLRAGDIGSAYLACIVMKNWPVEKVLDAFDFSSTSSDPRVGDLQISLRMIQAGNEDPFLIIVKKEWILLNNRRDTYLMKYEDRVTDKWKEVCEREGRFLTIK